MELIVLPVQQELLPVHQLLISNLVLMDITLFQLEDLTFLVMFAQQQVILLLVIMLPMLLAVNQDLMLLMDNVLLAQAMLNHVKEELLPNVTLDSS